MTILHMVATLFPISKYSVAIRSITPVSVIDIATKKGPDVRALSRASATVTYATYVLFFQDMGIQLLLTVECHAIPDAVVESAALLSMRPGTEGQIVRKVASIVWMDSART